MKRKTLPGFALAVFLVFCSIARSPCVYGISLQDLLSHEQAGALLAGEKPILAQFKEIEPGLVPRNEFLKGLIGSLCRDLEPSVMVETLRLYKKPQEAEKAVWSDEEAAGIYNGALALSTLAGIQYFSASRGAMRTFYETSSIIDGPSTKKPLPDPVYTRPPAEISVYARQKDLTFGDNIYQYDFYTVPGGLIFVQQNLTSLNAGIVPAIGKNKLRSVVAVLDGESHLLVYAGSMAKAASLPGMKERMRDSFANRAEAVIHWFSDQADKTFKKARL